MKLIKVQVCSGISHLFVTFQLTPLCCVARQRIQNILVLETQTFDFLGIESGKYDLQKSISTHCCKCQLSMSQDGFRWLLESLCCINPTVKIGCDFF